MTVNHLNPADRSKGSDAIATAAAAASKRSEDNSRRMILESYERAGVDLPLVELETVLDREISEDDPRQNGAPRFRKFLNKASSALANRGLNNDNYSNTNDNYSNNNNNEQGPDDEIESDADADVPSVLSTSSYTSNSNAGDYETSQLDITATTRNVPSTPDRPVTSGPNCNDDDDDAEAAVMMIPPPTPESMKNDLCNPAAFDFCCPKSALNDSPAKIMVSDNKYTMSNLQLAEGFDDEHQIVDDDINNLQESALDVPALMDVEDSMQQDTNSSGCYSMEKQPRSIAKGFGGGNFGILSYFQGNRRFRYSILVCCLLHVVLIGLIIAFVASAGNNETASFVEAGSSQSSSTISQGQTAATISPSTNAAIDTSPTTATNPDNIVTSKTLLPEPPVFPEPDLGTQLDPVVEENTESTSSAATTTIHNSTNSTQHIIAAEEENVFQENTTVVVVPEDEQPPSTPDASSCVNSLEVSTECVGEGSELYVYFESCTPQPGDWVAIYESSDDPQNLSGSEWIGWLYTCGDRICTEAVQKEVLSFTRAKDNVAEDSGSGTYRAHLMREGEGPVFSSIASTPDFRIVTDADGGC